MLNCIMYVSYRDHTAFCVDIFTDYHKRILVPFHRYDSPDVMIAFVSFHSQVVLLQLFIIFPLSFAVCLFYHNRCVAATKQRMLQDLKYDLSCL